MAQPYKIGREGDVFATPMVYLGDVVKVGGKWQARPAGGPDVKQLFPTRKAAADHLASMDTAQ